MHPFCAIQIENAQDRGTVRLRRDAHEGQACNGAKIHGNNAGLLLVSIVESLDHKNRRAFFDHVIDDGVTGFEV